MKRNRKSANIDYEVVNHFGNEWAKFNYLDGIASEALDEQFSAYMKPLNLTSFSATSCIAADFGAGSGRWAERLKPFFRHIYALEPSKSAFEILQKKFHSQKEFTLLNEGVENNSIPDESLDLAMSLGVLHHIPDTKKAIRDICKKVKPGGIFLCYLYYKLEEKPIHYRTLFIFVNFVRKLISRMPNKIRMILAKLIALTIYLPLARLAKRQAIRGRDTSNFPLHHYADMPFVMLENDALDRFGTRLEQRFNKEEIKNMLKDSGFNINTLKFSDQEPFWTFAVSK